MLKGYVLLAADTAFGDLPVWVQWLNVALPVAGSYNVPWARAFPSTCLGVWALAGGSGVAGSFLLSTTDFDKDHVIIQADVPSGAGAFPPNSRLYILGFGF